MSLLEETKSILRRYGIRLRRSAGQHFLVNERVAELEVELAEVSPGERVLEVGAGIGNLTKYLLEAGCRVVAVEKDPLLARVLRERFQGEELEVLTGDVLRVEVPEVGKVVSNPPFSISSPLLFMLLRMGLERGVLLLQREFARRIVAEPGSREYSRLSVGCRFYADWRIAASVGRGSFYPPPEVDASVVVFTPKERMRVDEEFFLRFTGMLFPYRRKTLRRAMRHVLRRLGVEGEPERVVGEELLGRRVFTLTPEEVAELSERVRAWSSSG